MHFDEVYNVFTKVGESVLESILEARPQEMDDVDCESLSCEPSEAEIWAAISQLINGKAPGVDMITAKLLKIGGEAVVQWLNQLAAGIWHSETAG